MEDGGPARTRTWDQGIMRNTDSLDLLRKGQESWPVFRRSDRSPTSTDPIPSCCAEIPCGTTVSRRSGMVYVNRNPNLCRTEPTIPQFVPSTVQGLCLGGQPSPECSFWARTQISSRSLSVGSITWWQKPWFLRSDMNTDGKMVFVLLRFYLEHRVEPFMFRSLNLSNVPVGVCCGVGHLWSRVRPGAGTSESGPLRSRAGRPWPRAWPRRVDLRRQVVGSLSVGESAISNVCFGVQPVIGRLRSVRVWWWIVLSGTATRRHSLSRCAGHWRSNLALTKTGKLKVSNRVETNSRSNYSY